MPPLYEYLCESGHRFERYLPVSEYDAPQQCECGMGSQKVIHTSYIIGGMQEYQSPVTGEWITTREQRRNDLKRHDCVEWDAGMHEAAKRKDAEDWKKIDDIVDKSVTSKIESMPAFKREHLWNEMTSSEITIERK